MELNRYGRNAFVALVGPVFEHSPWIAQHTWSARPFENVNALHEALCQTMYAAEMEHQMALICAHPDLVGRLGDRASLTSNSKAEQSSAGLNEISDEEASAFARYNAAYRARFGFPFIICARENKKTAIIDAFPVRLQNTPDQEIAIALSEIAKIARLRLQHRVYDPA
jgi:2-oxo-4-hydroxy-4-carboxy-5-ureidoimidazoline decarboxylase